MFFLVYFLVYVISQNRISPVSILLLIFSIYFKDLKAAFHMFDKNGDSKISEKELFEVMKYLGLNTTLEEAKAMIKVVDKNRESHLKHLFHFNWVDMVFKFYFLLL